MDVFHVILFEISESLRSAKLAAIRRARDLRLLNAVAVDTPAQLEQALRESPCPYDVAMVALDELEGDAIDALRSLKSRFPATSFVVCSASNRLDMAQRAHAAGAAGFFRCDSPPELVVRVLHMVLGGEAFAIPDHLRALPAPG